MRLPALFSPLLSPHTLPLPVVVARGARPVGGGARIAMLMACTLWLASACEETRVGITCGQPQDCPTGQACVDGWCAAAAGDTAGAGDGVHTDTGAGDTGLQADTQVASDAHAQDSTVVQDTTIALDTTLGWDTLPNQDTTAVCEEFTFPLTETQENFVVPSTAKFMYVKAWGAGGNGEGQPCGYDDSGFGGFTEAVFEVTPGEPLAVIVGKRGRAGLTGEEIVRFGFGSWGGGGLSGVFRGSEPITENDTQRVLLIAGGGGGASAPNCHPGGHGNHPNAGGMPSMLGGTGVDDVNGGAGGYAGGTGGAHLVGGIGGSGFVASDALDQRMLWALPGDAVPPATTDADYNGTAAKGEQSGHVIIRFECTRRTLN